MSGPKVVRIVTREEILEICNGLLARVDAALAEWIRTGQRNECVDEQAVAEARRRRATLAALIAADKFMDFQKQAPVEEAFLREDIKFRLAQIAAEQAAARLRGRREQEAALSLLKRLCAGGKSIDPGLEDQLRRGETGAISEGFSILAARSSETTASRELASKLRDECPVTSFAEWLANRPTADFDPAVERLELRVAELKLLVPEAVANIWIARLDEAATAEQARCGLLLDGLDVETGRALTALRQRASLKVDFDLLLAELDAAGIESGKLRNGIDVLDVPALATRIVKAQDLLESHRAASAAIARREAVLKQLSALGYEIAEGMDAALAQEGRLIVRSATRPDYGVEVSAADGSERMQIRAVAFDVVGLGPDTARDRDAETIWCGDVSTLQKRLTEIGGGLVIEKALPVGATPLKRIAIGADRNTAAEVPISKTQSLS